MWERSHCGTNGRWLSAENKEETPGNAGVHQQDGLSLRCCSSQGYLTTGKRCRPLCGTGQRIPRTLLPGKSPPRWAGKAGARDTRCDKRQDELRSWRGGHWQDLPGLES